jgi:murein L,D-transpeptidase YafK
MRFGGLFAAAVLAAVIALPTPASARNKNFQVASLPDNPVVEQADQVVVYKSQRRLVLLNDGRVLKSYMVALGKRPVGPKLFEGDLRTPEGRYHIDYRLRNSGYHRALHISYPNDSDLDRSNILRVDPGGDIMIHGLPNGRSAQYKGHPYKDWTAGCVAVTNAEIQEIWAMVPDGTPIDILP